jgi:DNA-binding MarR family transcriptional regulator
MSIFMKEFFVTRAGYIYVLANPSTGGIVKIGKTRQNPSQRARELSSAPGVPTPFIVVYQAYFHNCDQAELFVHSRLKDLRISNNREFFQVEVPAAVDAVIEAKNIFSDVEKAEVIIEDNEVNQNIDFDDIRFEKVQEPERGLYQLLDVFMNHSMRSWNNFVRSRGLSIPQFSILMQLYYQNVFSISEISDRFGISVPAASQLVEKLVQAGYLDRSEDPKDRRARVLSLSSKGQSLIEQGFKSRYRWIDELIGKLSVNEQAKVIKALRILIENAKIEDN